MISCTCNTRRPVIANILHRTSRRRRPLPSAGRPYGVCNQVPIIPMQQQEQQHRQVLFVSSIPSSSTTTDISSLQRRQTSTEAQLHHRVVLSNNNSDRELAEEEEDNGILKGSMTKHWSLQEISNIDRWDHPQIPQMIDDISYRLQYQLKLLEELSQILSRIRRGPILLASSMPGTTSGSSSSSPITSNGMMLRPYWWTMSQESQLIQEIEKQQREIINLQRLYKDTYQQIQQYQSLTSSNNDNHNQQNQNRRHLLFKLFGEIYSRHALTIETFAEMVISLKQIQQPKWFSNTINELLQERLGMLLLCDHITQICNNKKKSSSPIVENEDIVDLVSKAVTEAKHLCEVHYLTSPNVHIIENNDNGNNTTTTDEASSSTPKSNSGGNNNADDFFIVKPWLQYTLVELLKNSMSVTVERNRTSLSLQSNTKDDNDDHHEEQQDDDDHETLYYPIYIIVESTNDNTTNLIRISIYDQGGGIIASKSKKQKKLFEFAQHIKKWDRMDDQQTYAMTRSPLQGLGVGLSMSKMMMEYFGGTLSLEDRDADNMRNLPFPLKLTEEEAGPEPTATEEFPLERGVTATIVLPKDTTIVERRHSSS